MAELYTNEYNKEMEEKAAKEKSRKDTGVTLDMAATCFIYLSLAGGILLCFDNPVIAIVEFLLSCFLYVLFKAIAQIATNSNKTVELLEALTKKGEV